MSHCDQGTTVEVVSVIFSCFAFFLSTKYDEFYFQIQETTIVTMEMYLSYGHKHTLQHFKHIYPIHTMDQVLMNTTTTDIQVNQQEWVSFALKISTHTHIHTKYQKAHKNVQNNTQQPLTYFAQMCFNIFNFNLK